MQVQLTEIPEEGLELQVSDVSWFPDSEIKRSGKLEARIFLERRQERLMASGSIDLVYALECDRCLEEFNLPETIEFSLTLEQAGEADGQEAKEYQCDSSEMDVVFFEGTAVDISSILEQQVVLAYPVKKLCAENCLGLCAGCGHNLNLGKCGCPDKSAETPFSVLGQLIDK
ncbi:MAG: DUF177 domain-containing protein [Proteobacteria bacterium]|nr:DUF177 domain-containing protein [Pseudomonadota bacterium]MBU1736768.1 DUF177 domain-containing protein [Pseudomonadota bacterium]